MANTRPRIGKNPRAYEGVRAINPPDFVKKDRDPLVGIGAGNPLDYEYDIGTLWLNERNFNLWMLVDKEISGKQMKKATWIQLNSTLVGDITEIRDNNGLIVTPDAGGGVTIEGDLSVGIFTTRTGPNTLTISSTTGNPFLQTLTGNDSVVVAGDPADQNIDLFGDPPSGLLVESPALHAMEIKSLGGNRLMEILRDDGLNVVTATGPEGQIDFRTSMTTLEFDGTIAPNQMNLKTTSGGELMLGLSDTAATNVLPDSSGIIQLEAVSGLTITADAPNNRLLFETVPEDAVAFRAFRNNSLPDFLGGGLNIVIPFDAIDFDTENGFDVSTGEYTIPETGLWMIGSSIGMFGMHASAHTRVVRRITVNGGFIVTQDDIDATSASNSPADGVYNTNVHQLLSLQAGDVVAIRVQVEGGLRDIDVGAGDFRTNFWGFLLQSSGGGGGTGDLSTLTGSSNAEKVFPDSFNDIQLTAGTNMEILGNDAGNELIFNAVIPSDSESAFAADITASILDVTGDSTIFTIPFDRTFFNVGNDFNTTNGQYVAPSDGLYTFHATVSLTGFSGTETVARTNIAVTGTGPSVGTWALTANDPNEIHQTGLDWRFNGGVTVELAAGDIVTANTQVEGSGGKVVDVSVGGGGPPSRTWFTGYKINIGTGGGSGDLSTLTASSNAVQVSPTVSGDIELIAGTNIEILGDAGNNTLTFNVTGGGSGVSVKAFSAAMATSQNNVTGNGTAVTVVYGNTIFDTTSGYDDTTGIFTAQEAGTYFFTATVFIVGLDTDSFDQIAMTLDGPTAIDVPIQTFVPTDFNELATTLQVSGLLDLAVNDEVRIVVTVFGGTQTVSLNLDGPIFSGFLLQPSGGGDLSNLQLITDDAGVVSPVSDQINIDGVNNIFTTGSGNTVGINLDNKIDLGVLGTIAANDWAVRAVTGDIWIDSANLRLPSTTSTFEEGTILVNGERFIHSYDAAATSRNLFIGAGSGNGTMTNTSNLGIGRNTLMNLTSGQENVAIGDNVLQNISSGSFCVGINTGALASATTANDCIAIGSNSQGINQTASDNVTIGSDTLEQLLNGRGNVAIGFRALQVAEPSAFTVAIGATAMQTAINSDHCIGIGELVLNNNDGGADNIALGRNAAELNTSASDVIAIGRQALNANNTVNQAIAIGREALRDFTAIIPGSDENIAIGAFAMKSGTTLTRSIAIGPLAMENANNAEGSIAIGARALRNATSSGAPNIAIGVVALAANSTGERNIGIGISALTTNQTGSRNVSLGTDSGLSLTGSRNTAVGDASLSLLVGGDDNVAIGELSGSNYNGSESNNLVIANVGDTGDNNTIRIGETTGINAKTRFFAAGVRGVTPPSGPIEFVTIGTDGQLGSSTSSSGGITSVTGGNQINTTTIADAVTVDLDNTITLGGVSVVTPGTDALTVATGDVTIQGGNLDIPATDAGLDQGVISIDDTKFFTSFRDPAEAVIDTNWFLGFEAGTVGSNAASQHNIGLGNEVMQNLDTAVFNIGIGSQALQNLTGGFGNIAIGFAALQTPLVNAENSVVIGNLAGDGFVDCFNSVIIGHEGCGSMQLGQANTVVGYQALSQSNESTKTIAIGHHAALLYTTNESNNIIIGNPGTVGDNNTIRVGVTGTGIGQQDKCFVAGIRDGVASGSSFRDVIIDENDQLISAPEGFAFLAYRNSIVDDVTGAGNAYTTQWDQTSYNFGGTWNGTDTFTAPIDCIVEFFSTVRMSQIDASMTRGFVRLRVTGGLDWIHNIGSPGAIRSDNNEMSMTIKNEIRLNTGDTVSLQISIGGGAGDTANFGWPNSPGNSISTWFGGRLLDALL